MNDWIAAHGADLSLLMIAACLILLAALLLASRSLSHAIMRWEKATNASIEQLQAQLESRRIETDPVRLAVVAILALRADRQMTHDDLQNLVQDLQEDTRQIDALINEMRRLLGRSAAS